MPMTTPFMMSINPWGIQKPTHCMTLIPKAFQVRPTNQPLPLFNAIEVPSCATCTYVFIRFHRCCLLRKAIGFHYRLCWNSSSSCASDVRFDVKTSTFWWLWSNSSVCWISKLQLQFGDLDCKDNTIGSHFLWRTTYPHWRRDSNLAKKKRFSKSTFV